MKYIATIALSTMLISTISLISGGTTFAQQEQLNQGTLAIITVDGLVGGLAEVGSDGKILSVEISTPYVPDPDKEFEAWLVDDKRGGSAYYLNLGTINENGTLNYNEHLMNPYTYTHLEITSEPKNDLDPRPDTSNIVGTTELIEPFGK